jgi:hypothetical protein
MHVYWSVGLMEVKHINSKTVRGRKGNGYSSKRAQTLNDFGKSQSTG